MNIKKTKPTERQMERKNGRKEERKEERNSGTKFIKLDGFIYEKGRVCRCWYMYWTYLVLI